MAKFRETPCKYYVCLGECQKRREASHPGYCQKCGKYEPRAKMKHPNRKKDKIEKEKRKWRDEIE